MEGSDGVQIVALPAVLLVLVCLVTAAVFSAVRIVQASDRVVVTRWGRVVRVAGPGLALRIPGLERWRAVSLQPSRISLGVSTISSDGVPVHVQVAAECRVIDPARTAAARPDVRAASQHAVESLVAREVAHAGVAELLNLRVTLEKVIGNELDATTAEFGARVDDIEVRDIEVGLTMTLLESLRSGTRPEGRR